MHICFEEFKSTMELITDYTEAQRDADTFFARHRGVFADSVIDISGCVDTIISLLGGYFNVEGKSSNTTQMGGDILSWWINDKKMGELYIRGDIVNGHLPEEHKFRMPVLRSLEDLYDYLIWVVETTPPPPTTINEHGYYGYITELEV